jgi:diaminopimelate decarboxylase
LKELSGQISNGMRLARIIGVRLRPPQIASRFGVSVFDYQRFEQLVFLIRSLPPEYLLGVHFHIASSTIGTDNWWHLYESMLRWSKAIEAASRKKIQCLDVGGGWFPDDWASEFESEIEGAISKASQVLPELHVFMLEPGKVLVQPSMALAVRALEVRRFEDQVEEIVVDGSIAELPEAPFWPHRVLCLNSTGQEWEPLQRGNMRIIGRLCMEDDILAEDIYIPEHVQAGDMLIFCDAGAYDRSMSYEFGQG